MPQAKYKKTKKYVGKMTEARPLKNKPAKFAKPKDSIPKSARKMKMAKVSPKVAKVLKSQSRKSLARKVVSKLGLAGKAAVGLSIGYDIIKGVKPQKQGSSCSSGHRTIKNGGQTFCISNAKIKKAKMKTTNRATPDIKSKR